MEIIQSSSIHSIVHQFIKGYFESKAHKNDSYEAFQDLVERITAYHPWFLPADVERRMTAVAKEIEASTNKITQCPFDQFTAQEGKRIGVLLSAAIPFEGLEDLLAIVASGHVFVGKSLEKTDKLLSYLIQHIYSVSSSLRHQIEMVNDAPMRKLDAIIVYETQKPNPAVAIFTKHLPQIFRKFRKSVAILSPKISNDGLVQLGDLVLNYLGRANTNVSKIFVPIGFDVTRIYEAIEPQNQVMQHFKYANNFQYHQFLYLMNKTPFLDNGFLLLKEDKLPISPTAVLFYDFYETESEIVTDGYELVYRIV